MKIEHLSVTEYTVQDVSVSNIINRSYCMFDFEATGPLPEADCITQIGAVRLTPGELHKNDSFISLVKANKPIPQSIEQLTGITNVELESALSFSTVYDQFKAFIGDSVLVTQAGYEYDWTLLKYECERHNLPMLSNPILDTKALFTYLHPDKQVIVSTNFLIDYYQIDDTDIKRHNALGDSILIGRIFMKLIDEYRARHINSIEFSEPLTIKKMKLTPLV